MPESVTIHIDLALQGGGAHGAFTWGVLDGFVTLSEKVRAVRYTAAVFEK